MVSRGSQVGPDDAAGLVHRVGPHPDLLAERGRLARHVDALAVHVERPPVVHAAQRRVLVAPEVQRRAAVRAVLLHQPDPAAGVPERHQVLAQQPHPRRRAARARGSPRTGRPGSSTGAAARPSASRAHPGQDLVLFRLEHAVPPFLRMTGRCPGLSFSPSHQPMKVVNY